MSTLQTNLVMNGTCCTASMLYVQPQFVILCDKKTYTTNIMHLNNYIS